MGNIAVILSDEHIVILTLSQSKGKNPRILIEIEIGARRAGASARTAEERLSAARADRDASASRGESSPKLHTQSAQYFDVTPHANASRSIFHPCRPHDPRRRWYACRGGTRASIRNSVSAIPSPSLSLDLDRRYSIGFWLLLGLSCASLKSLGLRFTFRCRSAKRSAATHPRW